MFSKTIALGIGSNLGNSLEVFRNTLELLKKNKYLKILNVSSIYESEAQVPTDAPNDWQKKYLNACVVAKINEEISPLEILNIIKDIELQLGRSESERWAPRIIDIDILEWSGPSVNINNLSIPHQRLFERPFALLPLLEAWPDLRSKYRTVLPLWAQPWSEAIPFKTKSSSNFFWPKMVGILNVTPDSFSDGGKFLTEEALLNQVELMQKSGVDVLDIGAESTRPNANAVSLEEEYKRLDSALRILSALKISISLDCRRPQVVKRVLEKYKIEYLNDVEGFHDSDMQTILRESGLTAIVMHSLGVPHTLEHTLNVEIEPCGQLRQWWQTKREQLLSFGIKPDKLIFDAGIGFGKTKLQNIYILNHLEDFAGIQEPILVGHSRKSYQTIFSERDANLRDLETSLFTLNLNLAHTQYLRIHNIETQKVAIRAKGVLA